MDERSGSGLRRRKLWVGLGAVAVVFLCLAVCGLAALFLGPVRAASGHWAFDGVHPPFLGRYAGWGLLGISVALRLLFFGLLLLALILVLRRVLWGHHTKDPRFWGGQPGGRGEGAGHRGAWDSETWHQHARHWGPPPWWASPPDSGSASATEAGVAGDPGDVTESDTPDPGATPE